MAKKRLTERQELFCLECVRHGNNVTLAYQKAYECKYSTANKNAYKLYRKPEIQAQIEVVRDRLMNVNASELDYVLQRLWWIISADISAVLNVAGDEVSFRSFADLPPEISYALSEVSLRQSDQGSKISIKMESKLKAIEMYLKVKGYLNDMNVLVSCLSKYGLFLYEDKQGVWQVSQSPSAPSVNGKN